MNKAETFGKWLVENEVLSTYKHGCPIERWFQKIWKVVEKEHGTKMPPIYRSWIYDALCSCCPFDEEDCK